jgi:hypothetical protein
MENGQESILNVAILGGGEILAQSKPKLIFAMA